MTTLDDWFLIALYEYHDKECRAAYEANQRNSCDFHRRRQRFHAEVCSKLEPLVLKALESMVNKGKADGPSA